MIIGNTYWIGNCNLLNWREIIRWNHRIVWMITLLSLKDLVKIIASTILLNIIVIFFIARQPYKFTWSIKRNYSIIRPRAFWMFLIAKANMDQPPLLPTSMLPFRFLQLLINHNVLLIFFCIKNINSFECAFILSLSAQTKYIYSNILWIYRNGSITTNLW